MKYVLKVPKKYVNSVAVLLEQNRRVIERGYNKEAAESVVLGEIVKTSRTVHVHLNIDANVCVLEEVLRKVVPEGYGVRFV